MLEPFDHRGTEQRRRNRIEFITVAQRFREILSAESALQSVDWGKAQPQPQANGRRNRCTLRCNNFVAQA